ncbi:potassium channel family protein [Virgibacillus alimentarius]|uniref:Voltage-gated potassium channel n=1 Tax=Virgibacillus alimentarius TaxID=698769 RepID=A0ABS4S738_9BACI|nr:MULTISPECIES: potassium channel family protein [Virgibacillus]MBP2257297.1 voltage-gated potassium channel [Virgibacillus alimentarius]HLR67859.1 potassium channel family protein [Virgibacillus sp.]
MSIEFFKNIYFRLPIILRLLITILVIMLFFGIIIRIIEPDEFPTIFEGVWWAFVTGATVGYGDYVPLTVMGKIIGIFLILSGGGLLTFYITTLSAATINHERNLSKGKIEYKGKDHIIFIGWNERTRKLIEMTEKHNPNIDIVLIDRTLKHLPFQKVPVHFIHGNASEDNTLRQAHIETASCVVITADFFTKEHQPDHYTILTTVAIRGNNSQIPIITEIFSTMQIDNALRAGASTILRPNDFMSLLMYHELFHEKEAHPFEAILQLLTHQQFRQTKVPEHLIHKSVRDASFQYFKNRHIFLGIIREEEWKLNPSPDLLLQQNDIVVTLSHW